MQYIDDVKQAVADVLELENTTGLSPDLKLEEDLGFDSGLFIELIMSLEDRIPSLTIDPARLHREDFFTIGRIAGFIAKHIHASSYQ